jgi:hypothetical protein
MLYKILSNVYRNSIMFDSGVASLYFWPWSDSFQNRFLLLTFSKDTIMSFFLRSPYIPWLGDAQECTSLNALINHANRAYF